jgi:hypothetical protein
VLRLSGGIQQPGQLTVFPANSTLPLEGSVNPAIMRNNVVFPQPEGPSNPNISPSSSLKLTSVMAGIDLEENFLLTRSTLSMGDRFIMFGCYFWKIFKNGKYLRIFINKVLPKPSYQTTIQTESMVRLRKLNVETIKSNWRRSI